MIKYGIRVNVEVASELRRGTTQKKEKPLETRDISNLHVENRTKGNGILFVCITGTTKLAEQAGPCFEA